MPPIGSVMPDRTDHMKPLVCAHDRRGQARASKHELTPKLFVRTSAHAQDRRGRSARDQTSRRLERVRPHKQARSCAPHAALLAWTPARSRALTRMIHVRTNTRARALSYECKHAKRHMRHATAARARALTAHAEPPSVILPAENAFAKLAQRPRSLEGGVR
eukprot:4825307-Pleurochrysis_carterae.AAC.1